MKKQLPNILIIIATAFIMQSHAINLFWSMLGEDATWYEKATAIMMPLTLEAVALSAWYYTRFEWSRRALMIFVALATSGTMAYIAFLKMSKPVSDSISKTELIEEKSKLNKSLIEVVGTKVKDTAKYGTHKSTARDTKEFIKAVEDQKIVVANKSKLAPKSKLEAELNVIGMAMLLIIVYQTIAISIISRELEIEESEQTKSTGENKAEAKEQKQEQAQEQQENVLEPTIESKKACSVKKEIREQMRARNIIVPSQFMMLLLEGTSYSDSTKRGLYTKLDNTCQQKKGDTLGMNKMIELEQALINLKNSN